ncbi:MAG: 2,3-bisphosphoglycerate-independent phosphoglycerate mutase [Saprospiraceae bacterium]
MNKALLIILDGFGIGVDPTVDAIATANTPCYDDLMKNSPNSTLITHGLDVGLPEGQMGNSEVGHMNLGAGRIVYQDLTRIDLSIKMDELKNQAALLDMIQYSDSNNKPIHLIGLFSDGGVHSHINHLFALIDIFENSPVREIYIHAISDGRDTDPHALISYLEKLLPFIRNKKAKLATIVGRYYAMDRDQRWERIAEAYNLYCKNIGTKSEDAIQAVRKSYENGESDEFIKPIQLLDQQHNPYPAIRSGDVVFCFNFRSDRLRQLTKVLSQERIPDWDFTPLDLKYYTMTEYDKKFEKVSIVFAKDNINQSLGEILSIFGIHQLRIAETEKYAHVTYFFNGGREIPFSGERRIMIPSPKVATYDLQATMSANEITSALLNDLKTNHPEFVCLNFANTDMVGHTGVFKAAVEAAETVDHCLQKIIEEAVPMNYDIVILADHGNSDCMINPDGSPNTAHTKNPVPCILISKDKYKIKNGRLSDIAPTILNLMRLPVPAVMTGENLLVSEH